MPRPSTSEMEVRVEQKTTVTLLQEGSLRCLLETRYEHNDLDRQIVPVMAWARREAGKASQNLLKGAGLDTETGNFTFVLNGIKLGIDRGHSYVCFDLHLDKCSFEARERIDQSTQQPIHLITRRGDISIARRAPKCDTKVASFLEQFVRHYDHIPRPFFQDAKYPPLHYYRKRMEIPKAEDFKNQPDILVKLTRVIYFGGPLGVMLDALRRCVAAGKVPEDQVEKFVDMIYDRHTEDVIKERMQKLDGVDNDDECVKKNVETQCQQMVEGLKGVLGVTQVKMLKQMAAAKKNSKTHANKGGKDCGEEDEGVSRMDQGRDQESSGAQTAKSGD